MSEQFLPLLKPQNIQQLKSLILQIMEDNESNLQKLIQNRQNQALQQGQQFSLEDLNQILTEQCLQKQKTISNLSHFALSLMNTIGILWQDNQDLQYKVGSQRQIVGQMNQHLHQLNKQTEFYKNKLQQTYNDLHRVEQEKISIENYFNSMISEKEQKQMNQANDFQIERLNINEHGSDNKYLQRNNESYQLIFPTHVEAQTSISLIQHSQRKQTQNLNVQLLEQSVIKDSISILRSFTLAEETQNLYQNTSQNLKEVKFIEKSNKFNLVSQVSLSILEQQKQKQTSTKQYATEKSFIKQQPQKTIIKDLKISNQKINVTIATGTQLTKTRDQQKNNQQSFSRIYVSPSCTSLLFQRQNSTLINPVLERTTSTMNFSRQSTKYIQTDFDEIKVKPKKVLKKGEQKTKVQPSKTLYKVQQKILQQEQQKPENEQKSIINGLDSNKKSFTQIFDYFTKKIVSDRIKTYSKKNQIKGFKKSKSNIQKLF